MAKKWERPSHCGIQSHQAEIRLIHQSGALQSVVGTFLAQLKVRQTLQFLVDHGQQGVQSLAVSTAPAL
jgi:hypothetical protein